MFVENGHKKSELELITKNYLKIKNNPVGVVADQTKNGNITKKLPWIPRIGSKLRKELKRYGAKVIFTTPPTLKRILCNNKSKLLPNSKSGVYKLTCSCGGVYIGETKKKIIQRSIEHQINSMKGSFELGAKIDAKSEENLTPLHLAAKYGRCRVVEILLSIVSSIVKDVDISSNTPLHLASIEGHVAVVDMLIKSGAAVDVRNSGNWTPLDCAAFHGWTNCVQSLLNADSLVNPIEKEMVSPLQLACKKGHVDVVKLLLSRNADVSWKDHLGRNCLDYAIDSKQRETAITIISNNNWKMALHNTTFEGNELTTPMRKND
ncbi:transient receptor potential cation channel subfamily A member 1-like [Hydra vulgaris]|uniref:transient receptor potential cation channel subfamily A member 1-like n=1 Tax=Hydra vulgaris TaxID=6087 RepID=UPI0032EA2AAD